MEKRIALLKDGIVFNIIIAESAEEMAILFECQAIEITEETRQAYIGFGFSDGKFEQKTPSDEELNPHLYIEPLEPEVSE